MNHHQLRPNLGRQPVANRSFDEEGSGETVYRFVLELGAGPINNSRNETEDALQFQLAHAYTIEETTLKLAPAMNCSATHRELSVPPLAKLHYN